MAVLGPPGGVGEEGRPVEAPTGELTGEDARGEDCLIELAWGSRRAERSAV